MNYSYLFLLGPPDGGTCNLWKQCVWGGGGGEGWFIIIIFLFFYGVKSCVLFVFFAYSVFLAVMTAWGQNRDCCWLYVINKSLSYSYKLIQSQQDTELYQYDFSGTFCKTVAIAMCKMSRIGENEKLKKEGKWERKKKNKKWKEERRVLWLHVTAF